MALALSSTAPLTTAITIPNPPTSSVRSTRPMTARCSRPTKASNFIVDWNNPSTSTTPGTAALDKLKSQDRNLQEAFRRFREQRMDEFRLEQGLASAKKKKFRRSDPERMRRLRSKFVEQAKKYLGVPYAKKYFEPGTSEYESKIFLDCCGLVRRVMYDLSKEFGFIIGPWNQSYMFDTLPKTITHLSDVQPGDLVFISATYYNPKMKKQRHNLAHVEIMLGDGEKTIGARWNNGKVQFFDSYKFISKSYHSQIYTIKSLDPWLRGICKSHCPEHTWYRRQPKKANKKSIFYPSDQVRPRRHRHSSKANKGASQSSSSSINSSNKKSRHRKRKRRTGRSKSHRRSSSATLSTEKTAESQISEQQPLSSPLDVQSSSSSSSDDEDEERDRSVTLLNNQLATLNCQDDQEQCDDSDSMDEAFDAELLEEDNANTFIQGDTNPNIQ